MNDEIRLAIATSVLQGLVAHRFVDGENNGISLVGSKDAARLAFEFADALIAEARRTSPTSEAAGEIPPAAAPAAPASGENDEGIRPRDLGGADGPTLRVECGTAAPESAPPPPRPRKLAPQCEAPDCPLQGRPRTVEGTIDRIKRDVLVAVCDLHFDGVPASILLEWHHAFRNGKEFARAG